MNDELITRLAPIAAEAFAKYNGNSEIRERYPEGCWWYVMRGVLAALKAGDEWEVDGTKMMAVDMLFSSRDAVRQAAEKMLERAISTYKQKCEHCRGTGRVDSLGNSCRRCEAFEAAIRALPLEPNND